MNETLPGGAEVFLRRGYGEGAINAVAEGGLRQLVSFLAGFDQLAMLNQLPLPVLDGGHVVMAILEKVRGRPLSSRLVQYLTTAFVVLLVLFMLYVSYNDLVRRSSLFKSLWEQKTQVQSGPPATNPAATAKP